MLSVSIDVLDNGFPPFIVFNPLEAGLKPVSKLKAGVRFKNIP